MPREFKIHDVDVPDFIKALDACKGDVILNLKSKLCQIAGLANILKGATIAEATIRCVRPEDETILFRFNLYKELPNE